MEIILFGNSISLFNLAVMTFLYIFTISVALCGTVSVENLKSLVAFLFKDVIEEKKAEVEEENEEGTEGFTSFFKKCPCKKKGNCKKFSQNKCIDENPLHELNDVNAYKLEPASFNSR